MITSTCAIRLLYYKNIRHSEVGCIVSPAAANALGKSTRRKPNYPLVALLPNDLITRNISSVMTWPEKHANQLAYNPTY